MERSRTLGLVLGMLLAAGPAVAQEERPPADVETLDPVTVQPRAAEDRVASSAVTLDRVREIPLMTPFGPADYPSGLSEYFELKQQAASDPRVQAADQALEPPGPTAQAAAGHAILPRHQRVRGRDLYEDERVLQCPARSPSRCQRNAPGPHRQQRDPHVQSAGACPSNP